MASDENLLEPMLERATNANEEIIDELAVQMFCMIVRNDSTLIHKATDLIVSKIRSPNITESTRAISLLEECMTKCGIEFQDEVSKFRFLNDLIRLVSKKYQGAETPSIVKEKIMDCLLLWTTEHPQRNKIREAYDMLRKEGVEHEVSSIATSKRDSIMGIDEQKLRKLIQSGDAENFKRANLLIQYRVNQDARRTELILRHRSELQEVQNTVIVLNQMLDNYVKDDSDKNDETANLMRDLYSSCKRYKPVIQRLPELIENNDESLVADTLQACDILQAVMERYVEIVGHTKKAKSGEVKPANSVTLQNANDSSNVTAISTDLLTGLLDQQQQPEALVCRNIIQKDNSTNNGTYALEELMFGNVGNTSSGNTTSEIFKLLEPTPISYKPDNFLMKKSPQQSEKPQSFRELREIDEISEELLKANLATVERVGGFKNESGKFSLNDLAKVKLIPTMEKTSTPLTLLEDNKKNDEVILNEIKGKELTSAEACEKQNFESNLIISENIEELLSPENLEKDEESKEKLPFKHLSDIEIELDDVNPNSEERVLLDDDIKITLNFTTDRPSRNVSVVVISAVNRSKLPVRDFHFDASVRKPSKVRLLQPSSNEMPAHKPFRPPTPINQIMLLLNPTERSVDVTCIVGYKLGDDPDPIKESIVAQNIPYVE